MVTVNSIPIFWQFKLPSPNRVSIPESVFHLWYHASYSPVLRDDDSELYKLALDLFEYLRELSRIYKLDVGSRVLSEQLQFGA
jgi:hypothetical protein